MAHLWVRDEDETNEWAVLPLEGDHLSLGSVPTKQFRSLDAVAAGSVPTFMRIQQGGDEAWTFVANREHRPAVNGIPLHTGIRVLRDRDEVHLPGAGSLFFSSERLARVEPLPSGLGEVFCPRCRQQIADGNSAVRCPGPPCGLWHHQSAELPCWTYAEHCAGCAHPTAMDSGFRWSPADL